MAKCANFSAPRSADKNNVFVDLTLYLRETETILQKWDAKVQKTLSEVVIYQDPKMFYNFMKEYVQFLERDAEVLENTSKLTETVLDHINSIYSFYTELWLETVMTAPYLENMEDMMCCYCKLKFKEIDEVSQQRTCQKTISELTRSLCQVLKLYLMQNEMHISHVLLRIEFKETDKCRKVLEGVLTHFLLHLPRLDQSDEAFCRYYIIIQRWKKFRDKKDHIVMEKIMYEKFKRTENDINKNPLLRKILKPPFSLLRDRTKVSRKVYVEYVNKRRMQENEPDFDSITDYGSDFLQIGDEQIRAIQKEIFNDDECIEIVNLDDDDVDDDVVWVSETKLSGKPLNCEDEEDVVDDAVQTNGGDEQIRAIQKEIFNDDECIEIVNLDDDDVDDDVVWVSETKLSDKPLNCEDGIFNLDAEEDVVDDAVQTNGGDEQIRAIQKEIFNDDECIEIVNLDDDDVDDDVVWVSETKLSDKPLNCEDGIFNLDAEEDVVDDAVQTNGGDEQIRAIQKKIFNDDECIEIVNLDDDDVDDDVVWVSETKLSDKPLNCEDGIFNLDAEEDVVDDAVQTNGEEALSTSSPTITKDSHPSPADTTAATASEDDVICINLDTLPVQSPPAVVSKSIPEAPKSPVSVTNNVQVAPEIAEETSKVETSVSEVVSIDAVVESVEEISIEIVQKPSEVSKSTSQTDEEPQTMPVILETPEVAEVATVSTVDSESVEEMSTETAEKPSQAPEPTATTDVCEQLRPIPDILHSIDKILDGGKPSDLETPVDGFLEAESELRETVTKAREENPKNAPVPDETDVGVSDTSEPNIPEVIVVNVPEENVVSVPEEIVVNVRQEVTIAETQTCVVSNNGTSSSELEEMDLSQLEAIIGGKITLMHSSERDVPTYSKQSMNGGRYDILSTTLECANKDIEIKRNGDAQARSRHRTSGKKRRNKKRRNNGARKPDSPDCSAFVEENHVWQIDFGKKPKPSAFVPHLHARDTYHLSSIVHLPQASEYSGMTNFDYSNRTPDVPFEIETKATVLPPPDLYPPLPYLIDTACPLNLTSHHKRDPTDYIKRTPLVTEQEPSPIVTSNNNLNFESSKIPLHDLLSFSNEVNEVDSKLPLKKRRRHEPNYPAKPMLSIAQLVDINAFVADRKEDGGVKRHFKTPAELKEMPAMPFYYAETKLVPCPLSFASAYPAALLGYNTQVMPCASYGEGGWAPEARTHRVSYPE